MLALSSPNKRPCKIPINKIPISLKPDGVNQCYFKLKLFDLT